MEHKNTHTLYELDKNEEIQNKIMELISEIRKWFSFNGLKAVGEPSRIKRHWLSIIKQLTNTKYNLLIKELRYTDRVIQIKTQHYTFLKIII